jgi:hypothetical protein
MDLWRLSFGHFKQLFLSPIYGPVNVLLSIGQRRTVKRRRSRRLKGDGVFVSAKFPGKLLAITQA